MSEISLSTSRIDLELKANNRKLSLDRFGLRDSAWSISPHSHLFSVYIDEKVYIPSRLAFNGLKIAPCPEGMKYYIASFEGPGFQIEHHIQTYADTALVEMWPVIRNSGGRGLHLTRLDSVSIEVPSAGCDLLSFESDWGQEFEPRQVPLRGQICLETRTGKSSKGQHPWFALSQNGNEILSGSVAWSGNWIMRFEPGEAGNQQISMGLNDWQFSKELQPNQAMDCPHGLLVLGHDLNEIAQQYARVGRKFWYPHNNLARRLPVEWNPWWSYEDIEIDAGVFRENVGSAHDLEMELCTLDAGWFGPSQAGTHWFDYRGDWDLVNAQRFPEGLLPLSDQVHAAGMSFGLWCEIEAVGSQARLTREAPDFMARRDGQFLGYACFGNPAVQEWAFQTLSRLTTEFKCDWLKLDFNLDPGAGCNRTDHGHGSGDGLYEHYRGYYQMLERFRREFPQVVLENCSSGGMRIDLAMLRNTHLTFLSDPDWPVHALQVFWGASSILAADACLRWSFSDWRGEHRPAQQNFNPHDPDLTRHQLDYYTRIAMLGIPGFSQKLPNLPAWVAGRIREHIQIYKEHLRPFISQADVYRLTGQPRRNGTGPRWCAFQYSLHQENQHLLFVFRLPGAEKEQVLRLQGLQPERTYSIAGFEGESMGKRTGKELMTSGILFATLEEQGSELLRIY